jgi:hypothetical protein
MVTEPWWKSSQTPEPPTTLQEHVERILFMANAAFDAMPWDTRPAARRPLRDVIDGLRELAARIEPKGGPTHESE